MMEVVLREVYNFPDTIYADQNPPLRASLKFWISRAGSRGLRQAGIKAGQQIQWVHKLDANNSFVT